LVVIIKLFFISLILVGAKSIKIPLEEAFDKKNKQFEISASPADIPLVKFVNITFWMNSLGVVVITTPMETSLIIQFFISKLSKDKITAPPSPLAFPYKWNPCKIRFALQLIVISPIPLPSITVLSILLPIKLTAVFITRFSL